MYNIGKFQHYLHLCTLLKVISPQNLNSDTFTVIKIVIFFFLNKYRILGKYQCILGSKIGKKSNFKHFFSYIY